MASHVKEAWRLTETLDKHKGGSFYWSLTIMATIGGFLFGYDLSNIGSALNFVPYHLGSFALGYLVAGSSLGAAIGALAAGPVTDAWGRKSLLILDAAIYAAGALLSAFTVNAFMLLASRTLIGLAIGADSAIATVYIAEYAPKARRGSLAILQQWMITVGIFMAYIVGIVVFSLLPNQATTLDWRLILGLGAVPAIIGLIYRMHMPESPRWLLQHGQLERLRQVLRLLGIEASMEDLRQARKNQSDDKGQTPKRITPGMRYALLVAGVFMIFQQITGINIPLTYGPKILKPYFASGHVTAVHAAVSGIEATLVLATVNMAATYIGFRLIDSWGRRRISRVGFAGMAVFMVLAALALTNLGGIARVVTLLSMLAGFIVFFAFGVGGTGWIIEGEYFPTALRGRMAALVAFIDWTANFVIVEAFPVLQKGIGLTGVMLLFAILSVLAVGFISRWMPETKGLSVEEITDQFDRIADSRSHI
ncbi:MAG: sugar porter family MFS transporter [Firmicutes bacterium]|nr:sugar porter family MFS transporter [Bacillota bacterium]MCL5013019.1 sugar porter family MFS transporter [Bacillota bacterium]